jgi:hypothetical protein
MGEKIIIRDLNIKSSIHFLWTFEKILSFNINLNKSYKDIKNRIVDISKNFNEWGIGDNIEIYSAQDFYYYKLSSRICDYNSINEEEEKEFIDSLFDRFCNHNNIFPNGFIIIFRSLRGNYNNTIQYLKNEIIYSDSEF